MKKNKMMRLASGLLVAVLITTSTISGTFAKYTTADEAQDSARVAKFGVEVVAAGKLFNDSYKDDFTTYTTNETGDAITVQAYQKTDPADNVVAPGTNNATNPFTFTVTGTPEVDVEVVYTANLALTGWEVDLTDDGVDNPTYYCPLVIKVGATTFDGATFADAAAFETAVEGAITALSKERVDTNNDLATNSDLTITWEWPFSTSADNDIKDTALGDAAADGNAAEIEVEVTCTVNQLN